jgi:CDP-alcohol phosphatidyltransferase
MEWTKIVYKKISRPIVWLCINAEITANQVTVVNHLMTLTFGCYLFSRGTYWGGILGLLVNGFLDYLDGDIAQETGQTSKFGEWLDSGFDVIIQNAVMGAIAIGCFQMGLSLIWIILFFIANAGNNLVSFHYNNTFGFNSANGNELFRELMDKKRNLFNRFFKNLIDPTSSFIGLLWFTFRYFIVIGMIFNIMPACFILMTIIGNIKWFIMFSLYALHQKRNKYLFVVQILSFLDEERDEFYKLRNC